MAAKLWLIFILSLWTFPVSSTPSDVNCYLTSNALHLAYQLIFLSLFSEFKLYYLIFFSLENSSNADSMNIFSSNALIFIC